ncbi:hypothetical protein NOVOSPHI9U_370081 [Novosphingobium sp. 9U]|nr:hypothetical protein NOVOSPHI9U_370081 [Novosphingobium sp. 9U]
MQPVATGPTNGKTLLQHKLTLKNAYVPTCKVCWLRDYGCSHGSAFPWFSPVMLVRARWAALMAARPEKLACENAHSAQPDGPLNPARQSPSFCLAVNGEHSESQWRRTPLQPYPGVS